MATTRPSTGSRSAPPRPSAWRRPVPPTGISATRSPAAPRPRTGHTSVCEATSHVAGVEVAYRGSPCRVSRYRAAPRLRPRPAHARRSVEAAVQPDPYDVDVVDLVSSRTRIRSAEGRSCRPTSCRPSERCTQDAGLPLHLDGARIFNAAAAGGTAVGEFAAEVDALMFCLSQGPGRPHRVGSVRLTGVRRGGPPGQGPLRRGLAAGGRAWPRPVSSLSRRGRSVWARTTPARRRLAEGIAETTAGLPRPVGRGDQHGFVDTSSLGLSAWDARGRLEDEGVWQPWWREGADADPPRRDRGRRGEAVAAWGRTLGALTGVGHEVCSAAQVPGGDRRPGATWPAPGEVMAGPARTGRSPGSTRLRGTSAQRPGREPLQR